MQREHCKFYSKQNKSFVSAVCLINSIFWRHPTFSIGLGSGKWASSSITLISLVCKQTHWKCISSSALNVFKVIHVHWYNSLLWETTTKRLVPSCSTVFPDDCGLNLVFGGCLTNCLLQVATSSANDVFVCSPSCRARETQSLPSGGIFWSAVPVFPARHMGHSSAGPVSRPWCMVWQSGESHPPASGTNLTQ